MELGLSGKVALVTGASKGIGAAIALELAREGCDVAITARSEAALATVAQAVRKRRTPLLVSSNRSHRASSCWRTC